MLLVWTLSCMGIGIVVRRVIPSASLPTEIITSWMQWDGRCLDILHPAQTYCYVIFHISSLLKKALKILCSHWTMTYERLWLHWFRQQSNKLVRLVVSACASLGHLSKCLVIFPVAVLSSMSMSKYFAEVLTLYVLFSLFFVRKVRRICIIMEKCPQWVWKCSNLVDIYIPTHNTSSSTSRRIKFWSHCNTSTKQGKKMAPKILSSLLNSKKICHALQLI
jgi:hypothetical protein